MQVLQVEAYFSQLSQDSDCDWSILIHTVTSAVDNCLVVSNDWDCREAHQALSAPLNCCQCGLSRLWAALLTVTVV